MRLIEKYKNWRARKRFDNEIADLDEEICEVLRANTYYGEQFSNAAAWGNYVAGIIFNIMGDSAKKVIEKRNNLLETRTLMEKRYHQRFGIKIEPHRASHLQKTNKFFY